MLLFFSRHLPVSTDTLKKGQKRVGCCELNAFFFKKDFFLGADKHDQAAKISVVLIIERRSCNKSSATS